MRPLTVAAGLFLAIIAGSVTIAASQDPNVPIDPRVARSAPVQPYFADAYAEIVVYGEYNTETLTYTYNGGYFVIAREGTGPDGTLMLISAP